LIDPLQRSLDGQDFKRYDPFPENRCPSHAAAVRRKALARPDDIFYSSVTGSA